MPPMAPRATLMRLYIRFASWTASQSITRPAFEHDVLDDDPVVCRRRTCQALRLVPPEVGQHAAPFDLDRPTLRLLHRVDDAPELHILHRHDASVQHDLELSAELPVGRWAFDVRRLDII